MLREELESRRALRVCRAELWDLSHTEGWQVDLPALGAALVGPPAERQQILTLWRGLPTYLENDTANLRAGLGLGYSVPRPIVQRVLKQLDALTAGPPEQSPFYAPALADSDSAFTADLKRLVRGTIEPAIRGFATFLRKEYLPRARQSLSVSALPNGPACYRAYLRRYTTTRDTPAALSRRGNALASASTRELIAIGSKRYGTRKVAPIVERSRADSANRFRSADELLAFSRNVVDRSIAKSRSLFAPMPGQPVLVMPLPSYQQGTGVASHYQANPDERQPATFWIATDDWRTETRGAAEITAVHETVPGHHLQIATARSSPDSTGLSRLAFNAAYIEGWANYAEGLAEESGIDSDDYERLQRRVLAGRSLVIDPGIHAFDWSRSRAEAYAMETGMSREEADDLIDRIIVEPGQLTSYEMGGLEILALRESARRCLGKNFDIRAFHRHVLESGPIPLSTLRGRIEAWMQAESHRPHCPSSS